MSKEVFRSEQPAGPKYVKVPDQKKKMKEEEEFIIGEPIDAEQHYYGQPYGQAYGGKMPAGHNARQPDNYYVNPQYHPKNPYYQEDDDEMYFGEW